MTLTGDATPCLDCGQPRAHCSLPHGMLCYRCKFRRHYHPQPCPSCTATRPLAYLDTAGQVVCAGCAGIEESLFACSQCGREDHPYGAGRCARCILTERLTTLLTDPDTHDIHHKLRPVFDDLIAAPRPQSVITWLRKPPGTGPRLLELMARGQMPISHEAFQELASDRRHNYLRELLASLGVLPPFVPAIERMLPWLDTKLTQVTSDDSNVISRFAHWHVLRRLRHTASTGTLTKGSINNARAQINAAIRLCRWAHDHQSSVTELTQTDLERYLTEHPGSGVTMSGFIAWLRRSRLNTALRLATIEATFPEVTVSDADRWAHVNTLLHDETIRPYARIAGLFTLLFAQPLSAITGMHTDQITLRANGEVTVRFADTPVPMPPILDALIRNHLNRLAPPPTRHDHAWLFPGRSPGHHLVTESFRAELVKHGIHPGTSRNAALFGLAAELPAPVLADLIGVADKTATKWAALAGRHWSAYIPARRTHNPANKNS